MARQREFQAAAQRRTVQGGEHRLSESLDAQQHVVEQRCTWRRIEFAQIGAGDETSAGSVDDHAAHGRIRLRSLHGS